VASTQLTIDTLGDLDHGSARVVVNDAIAALMRDVDERGKDEKERKLVIELTVKQLGEGEVVMDIQAATKVPKYRTGLTIGSVRVAGKDKRTVQFQQFAADDPDQRTLDEAVDPGE